MSEAWSRFESLVEQKIRMAQERGEFDNLPGMGKPLPNRGEVTDDLWWIREYIRREGISAAAMLPPALRLAREIEQLPAKVATLPSEQSVRAAVAELNEQIAEHLRAPTGPHVPVRPVDPEPIVAHWQGVTGMAAKAARPPAPPTAEEVGRGRRRRWFGRRRPPSPASGPT